MRVRWTSDAADDLERISDYVAEDRPETSRRIALDIIQSIDALDTFPTAAVPGASRAPASSYSPHFRSLHVVRNRRRTD